jgi:excisionase family DNA binding protein
LKKYLTIFECAEYLKRSPGSIRNLVMQRRIPYRKPAGRLLFDLEEIDRWVQWSEGMSLEKIVDGR